MILRRRRSRQRPQRQRHGPGRIPMHDKRFLTGNRMTGQRAVGEAEPISFIDDVDDPRRVRPPRPHAAGDDGDRFIVANRRGLRTLHSFQVLRSICFG